MSATTLLLITPIGRSSASFPPANVLLTIPGIWSPGRSQRNRVFIPTTINDPGMVSRNCIQVSGDGDIEKQNLKVQTGFNNQYFQVSSTSRAVESIRSMFRAMDDGEISVSAYDTAWVALVEDVDGSGGPQFPESLTWIANNQLADGSWGDGKIFQAHDRIMNTLACVIALKSWNVHPDKMEKGLSFILDNIYKLEDESDEHMPIGFEVAFPSLLELTKKLRIDIPYHSAALQEIYDRRNLKLKRIPMEVMHAMPTTLLHSLEGMQGLDWQRLLSLKCENGSFLFSPSSTAYAIMQTRDSDCLRYVSETVKKFEGGVPNVYPVDLFERIWAVDRLQRLGISRYFRSEIDECIPYIHRYWTDKGICWARNTPVPDIDDTAMGFRILRLHGRDVSADVFQNFKRGDQFLCFPGQSTQAVTGLFNLYRASQVMFPRENILADARKFSSEFLQRKRANDELVDKWIITKDLSGEVAYALDVPWYASLPRLETRLYLEQYGGQDDVWIGKTLYRMPLVNNDTYLQLGKTDYNNCQALHWIEWGDMQKWYEKSGLGESGLKEESLLIGYYLAAASVFEPERSKERVAWAKTTALVETIKTRFLSEDSSPDDKTGFLQEIQYYCNVNGHNYKNVARYDPTQKLVQTILVYINRLSLVATLEHGRSIHQDLCHIWAKYLMALQEEGADATGRVEAELMVKTLHLCAGRHHGSEEPLFSHPKYHRLLAITNRICYRISKLQSKKDQGDSDNGGADHGMADFSSISSVESDMQELVELVLTDSSSNDLDGDIKRTFLDVARTFYYTAHCDPRTIDFHISKVLFERVI